MGKKHRTPEQWQTLIEQQAKSGLSVSKFCQQQGLAYSSFCKWRKRLSEQPAQTPVDSEPTNFLDLSSLVASPSSSRPGWNIVLSLGQGIELRLSQNS